MTADDRALRQDAPAMRVAAPRRRGVVGLAFLDAGRRLRIGRRMLAYLVAWSLVIGLAGEVLVGRHPTPARQLLALVAIPATVAITYGFRRWVDRRDWRGIGLPWPSRQQLVAGGVGFLVGVAVITVLFTVEWAAGWVQVTGSELAAQGLAGVTVLLCGGLPNLLAAAMLVAFVTALQLQVRLVEEPYLHRVHGDAWERYAARTGRFLPGIGRYHPGPDSA